MAEDPIVEEIHRIREELLEEHGGSDGYFEHIQEIQEKLGDRLVTREPRRPIVTPRPAARTRS